MPPAKALTPMLRHYLQVKSEHPDAILFYRMGDFYEMFFDDAELAAPVLEIALTARQKGTESEAPMCGVPHHALDSYLGKMVRAGFKVAICDQMEDPATAKGLVKREVTRVVTPGTLSEPKLLEGKEDNLLCALAWKGEQGAGAFLDVSTGKLVAHRWASAAAALETLAVLRPREAVFEAEELPGEVDRWLHSAGVCLSPVGAEDHLTPEASRELLERHFEAASVRGFGLAPQEPATRATALALRYVHETQRRDDLSHIRDVVVHEKRGFLLLDDTTLRNLEVLASLRGGGRKGTLLGLVDETRTAMGGRLLRAWLVEPLLDPDEIAPRHDAVEELVEGSGLRDDVRRVLGHVADLERLLSRAVLGSLTPREAAALRDSLHEAAALGPSLAGARARLLAEVAAADPCAELAALLAERLEEEPAALLRQGGVVASGVNEDLDEARSLVRNSKEHILALEAAERRRSGIASLKVGYNKVFGYYLEVTKANQSKVPDDYVRKQTLTNAERYVTQEIKELEEQILGAEERMLALEAEEYDAVVAAVVAAGGALRELASRVARLDVVAAFAELAVRRGYVRPRLGEAGGPIRIREGRHPVVEASLREEFVPNDTDLDDDARLVVLTGPNMGGKSTYLRQVALIVLLAQAGSFVPARSAEIGVVDRIFTRVGASDDLTRGESTFMVEMIETANILRYAGEASLVILDEVGRGTATFDGLSLAWAIVEHLHQQGRPRTIFATHYHELTELASLLPRVVNRTMAVKEWEDQIVFLRRVVPGSADKSYGLQVARLAGLPTSVIERAGEILGNLERQEYDLAGRPRLAEGRLAPRSEGPDQLALFTPPEELVAAILRDLDLDRLSPLAALNLLHALRSRLDPGAG